MAVGDRTEKRLVGPVALTASNATVGSAVPTSYQWTTKQIVICNTDGTDRLVYLAIGSAATASNRFVSALPVAAYDTVIIDTALVLNAGEYFYGYADRGSDSSPAAYVNVIAVGWEKQTA